MASAKRWAIQQIFTQTYKNVENTKVYATLDDLKTCNMENNETIVYSSGGVGNPYLTGHSHSKRCTGSATAATFKNEIIGLISGTDVATGAQIVPVNDEIVTVSSDSGVSKYTAVGTAGSEFVGLFVRNTDGTTGAELTQVASAPSAGEFSYVSGTKTFTFSTSEFADGTELLAYYNATSDADTQTTTNDASVFSKVVRIEMETLVQDVCSGEDFAATIIVYKAKLDGTFMFDLAADGDPATLDVSFEALRTCENSKLWDLIVYESLT